MTLSGSRRSRAARIPAAALLLALAGCASTVDLPPPPPAHLLNPLGVLSVLSESAGPLAPFSGPTMSGGGAVGAGVGGVGGTAAALASCAPLVAGLPLYVLCALSGAASGVIAGGIIGGGASDLEARNQLARELERILAGLPPQSVLAARLRAQVIQRTRTATPLEVFDLGATSASLALERTLAPGPQRSTLALRIEEIRVDALDSRRLQLSIAVQSELSGRGAADLSRTHSYRYVGEPIPRTSSRAEIAAAAERSIQEGLREAARVAVEAQLGARAGS